MGSPEHRRTEARAASADVRAPGGPGRPQWTARRAGEGTR